MPLHWTYASATHDSDLKQGNILCPTSDLKEILRKYHPYFADSKYTGFLITTQSCDLVRRDRPCSARYITCAAIRQLDDIFEELLQTVSKPISRTLRFYPQASRKPATDLLQRLYNQNETKQGLFYLHPDADVGITVPSVAVLPVTFALKSEHYAALQAARTGTLAPEFVAKLGWMVGHIYSRVGTPDWSDPPARQDALDRMIHEVIEGNDPSVAVQWIRPSFAQTLTQTFADLDRASREDVMQALQELRKRDDFEHICDNAATAIAKTWITLTPEQIELVKKAGDGNAVSLELTADQVGKFRNRLFNAGSFKNAVNHYAREQ